MDVTHFHRFAYQLPTKNGRYQSLHNLRDGDAFIEISTVLHGRGLTNRGTLLNLPGKNLRDRSLPLMETFGPMDLIVTTTRPPLNDKPDAVRKYLEPGNTALENLIHKELRHHFSHCARPRVRLAPHLAKALPPEVADRADIRFYQYLAKGKLSPGEYLMLRAHGAPKAHKKFPKWRTAVYLVRTQAENNGPWLLCAFGMAGNESLIWAYLLRTRYAHYLEEDGPLFVMGELHLQRLPKRPFTLEFVQDWKVDILLEERS